MPIANFIQNAGRGFHIVTGTVLPVPVYLERVLSVRDNANRQSTVDNRK
ncbi:hypothetical protein BH20ACI3_BH20ACI3_09910 [soil metagenome]